MTARIEPRELKALSDILALVLDDQPGGAAAALEAVRRRARHDSVTGGALKDLFRLVSTVPSQQGSMGDPAASQTIEALRTALRDTQRRLVETRLQLDRERRDADRLSNKIKILERGGVDHVSSASASHLTRLRLRIAQLEAALDEQADQQRQAALDDSSTSDAESRRRTVRVSNRRMIRQPARMLSPMLLLLVLGGLATDQTGLPVRPVQKISETGSAWGLPVARCVPGSVRAVRAIPQWSDPVAAMRGWLTDPAS